MDKLVIRNMKESDLDQIMLIQSECYTEVAPESRASLQNKLALSPDTCWVGETKDNVVAYLICHPWKMGDTPLLDTEIAELPETKDIFYIHDLSVSEKGRGMGMARSLVNNALSIALKIGFKKAGLVAVQGSSMFWGKFGFASSTSLDEKSQDKLGAYGEGAIYMEFEILDHPAS